MIASTEVALAVAALGAVVAGGSAVVAFRRQNDVSEESPDVFLAYADDSASLANELAAALKNHDLSVGREEGEGQQLIDRTKLASASKGSRYALVIVSPDLLSAPEALENLRKLGQAEGESSPVILEVLDGVDTTTVRKREARGANFQISADDVAADDIAAQIAALADRNVGSS